MTTINTTEPGPGAKDSAPSFPAEREVVSGHNAPFVDSDDLDARAFAELERCGQPWSWGSDSARHLMR